MGEHIDLLGQEKSFYFWRDSFFSDRLQVNDPVIPFNQTATDPEIYCGAG